MSLFSPHITEATNLPTPRLDEALSIGSLRSEGINPFLANIGRHEQAAAFAFPSRLRSLRGPEIIDLAGAMAKGLDGEHRLELLRQWPNQGTISSTLARIGLEIHYQDINPVDFMRSAALAQPPGRFEYEFPSDRQGQIDALKRNHYRSVGTTLRMMDVCQEPHNFWDKNAGELWDELRIAAYGAKCADDLLDRAQSHPLKTRRLVDLAALNVLADKEHFGELSIAFGNQNPGSGIVEAYAPLVGSLIKAEFVDAVQMEVFPGAIIFYVSPEDYETVERIALPEGMKSAGMLLADIDLKYDLGGRVIFMPQPQAPLPPFSLDELFCLPSEWQPYGTRRHEIRHAVMWSYTDPERRSRIAPTKRHLNGIREQVETGNLSFDEELNLHRTYALRLQYHHSDAARDETLAFLAGDGELSTHPPSHLDQWSIRLRLEAIQKHLNQRLDLDVRQRDIILENYKEVLGMCRGRVEEFEALVQHFIDQEPLDFDAIAVVGGLLLQTPICNLTRVQERLGLGSKRSDLQALLKEQKLTALQNPLIELEEIGQSILRNGVWPEPESKLLEEFCDACAVVKRQLALIPSDAKDDRLKQVVELLADFPFEHHFNNHMDRLDLLLTALGQCITHMYGKKP